MDSDTTTLCNGFTATCSSAQTFDALFQETFNSLRTRYYPTQSENNEISRHILESRIFMDQLDEEIRSLKEAVDSLERQRIRHQKCIDGLSGLQAPFRRLPTEIVTEIFRECVHFSQTSRLRESINLTPLRLGLVCRLWRDIMLSSNSLWATIAVGHLKDDQKSRHILAIVETYLQRSHPAPLSIAISQKSQQTFAESPVLRMLAAQSHRWYEVELHGLDDYLLGSSNDLRLVRDNLPLLERLTLTFESQFRVSTDLFATCPKLSYFESHYSSHIPLPFRHLTVLRGDSCDARYWLDIIASCTQLRQVTIREFQDHSFAASLAELPISSNLEVMTIVVSNVTGGEWGLSHLLGSLTLPCLRDMSVTSRRYVSDTRLWDQEAFVSLLQRSRCPLNALNLDRIPLTDTDAIQILQLIPTLTALTISECPEENGTIYPIVTNHFLQSLTIRSTYALSDGEAHLVPHLTLLELTVGPSFEENILRDMVESRRNPISLCAFRSDVVVFLDSLKLTFMKNSLDAQLMMRLAQRESTGMIAKPPRQAKP